MAISTTSASSSGRPRVRCRLMFKFLRSYVIGNTLRPRRLYTSVSGHFSSALVGAAQRRQSDSPTFQINYLAAPQPHTLSQPHKAPCLPATLLTGDPNMPTEKQIEAARQNGAKSKGPKTPEGKQRSSQNATQHAMLAETLVLHNESNAEFQLTLDAYTQQYQPVGPT